MQHISRRHFVKAGASGVAITALPLEATAQSSSQDTLEEIEAKYIAKHAAIRALAYNKFKKRYSLSQEQLTAQFKESLPFLPSEGVDSVSLKGIIINVIDIASGGRLGDVLTLKWYADTFEISGMEDVFSKGIITGSGTPTGTDNAAAQDGSQENESLETHAQRVANAAENYLSNPTQERKNSLQEALVNERKFIEKNTETIREWTQISPGSYNIQGIGTTDEAAEKIKSFAKLNRDTIDAFSSQIDAQLDAIDTSDVQMTIPKFLQIYEQNIQYFADGIPEAFRGMLFGESLNVYLTETTGTKDTEQIQQAVNVITTSEGNISSFELIPSEDAGVHIYTTKAVINDITNSEQPVNEAQKALDDDEIILDGQGFVNDVKYEYGPDIVKTGSDIVDSASKFLQDTIDFVDNFF
jgi:hypothetical protein